MARIKRSVASKKRKKRVLKQAKGQFGHRKSRFRQAKRSVIKGKTYATRDRKVKKREFRNLWIVRIKAACTSQDIAYSRFIKGLSNAHIELNRKLLADLAVQAPAVFEKLVEVAKAALSTKPTKPTKKAKSA